MVDRTKGGCTELEWPTNQTEMVMILPSFMRNR